MCTGAVQANICGVCEAAAESSSDEDLPLAERRNSGNLSKTGSKQVSLANTPRDEDRLDSSTPSGSTINAAKTGGGARGGGVPPLPPVPRLQSAADASSAQGSSGGSIGIPRIARIPTTERRAGAFAASRSGGNTPTSSTALSSAAAASGGAGTGGEKSREAQALQVRQAEVEAASEQRAEKRKDNRASAADKESGKVVTVLEEVHSSISSMLCVDCSCGVGWSDMCVWCVRMVCVCARVWCACVVCLTSFSLMSITGPDI